MTITLAQIGLYTLALVGIILTPGPVWVAISARALVGGFKAAVPLAVGVALGDLLWPALAIFGLGWVLSLYGDLLLLLRWVAVAVFLVMGILLILRAAHPPSADSRLTRPGYWAGFSAGVAVILANPKAILFYMGILPGFFALDSLTLPDIAVILFLSMLIPLLGNLGIAALVGQVRGLLRSPEALTRVNRIAGVLLVLVGLAIAIWG